jgi:hypothetical protein
MKSNLDQLLEQRQGIFQQMQALGRLRRGSLSKQFFPSGSGSSAKRGPYYVLQGFCHGKKFSRRIPADQAEQVQADVDNYRRFQSLAETYVTLSDQLADRQDRHEDSKKNSNRRRSSPNSSGKPPLS